MGITSYPAPSSGGFPYSSQPPVNGSSVLFDGQLVSSGSATKTISGNGGLAYLYASAPANFLINGTTYTLGLNSSIVATNAISGSVSATVSNTTTAAPTSWSLATTTFPDTVGSYSMFYGGGYYVMQGSNTGKILYSSDAVTWSIYTISGFNQVGQLGFDGVTWMYLGYVNSVGYCSATTTNIASAGSWSLNQNSVAGNGYALTGDGKGNWQTMQPSVVWWTNNNGINWNTLSIENLQGGICRNICTDGTYWVLSQTDTNGNSYVYVASSVSGPYVRNTSFTSGAQATFYANGLFIIAYGVYFLVSSTPAIASSWVTVPNGVPANICYQIAYLNGWYIAACTGNYTQYSSNGYTWTAVLVSNPGGGQSYSFTGVAGSNNGVFALFTYYTASGVVPSIWKSTNTYPAVPATPLKFGIYAGPAAIH